MGSDFNGDANVSNIIAEMRLNALKNREIFIWGEIDEVEELIVNRSLEQIANRDRINGEKKPIRINISSPGGSVFAGLSIISQIESLKEKGYEIHTYSYGYCMSAALFIFMTGSKRFSQKHTRFMLHHPSLSLASSLSVESAKRLSKDLDELWKRFKDISKKYSKFSDDVLDAISLHDEDYFFFPEQAVDFGVVDKII